MSERPEILISWLKYMAESGRGGVTPQFNAKCTLNYITQLEAELKEAKAEAKKFKVISSELSMDFIDRLDYLKRGLESFMAEHGMEDPQL